jgi:hypothetical protein
MNIEQCIEDIKIFFPKAFVYKEFELIVEPKTNAYFRIDNITTELEFKRKVIEFVSRSAHKHPTNYWRVWFKRGFNGYFRKNFSDEDLSIIYTKLGGGINRDLATVFVESDYDIFVLLESK